MEEYLEGTKLQKPEEKRFLTRNGIVAVLIATERLRRYRKPYQMWSNEGDLWLLEYIRGYTSVGSGTLIHNKSIKNELNVSEKITKHIS